MRRLALAAVAVLLTGGCGAAPPARSAAAAGPGVVVALDDFAALTALSLGVRPTLTFDLFGYETSRAIWADQGISPVPYGAELDVEKVVAAEPDVIIGVSVPTTAAHRATLERVAPTTVLDYTADWRAQLDATARALGRTEQAAELTRRIDADLAALRRDLGADRSVSVLGHNESTFAVPEHTGLGSLLRDAGLQRPAAQRARKQATAPFVDVSLERLTEHDAAAVFLMTGGAYDPGTLTGSPLWGRLGAVRAGRVHQVCAEVWFGTSPFAVDWVLDDLRATLVDGGRAATPAQAPARFRAFTGAAPAPSS